MKLCKEADAPTPFYSVGTNEVILTFRDPKDEIHAMCNPKMGSRSADTSWQKDNVLFWNLLQITHPYAKAISEKISEKIAVTDRTIESDLATLKKNGVIRHFGSRKDGHWEINAPKKE